MDIFNNDDTIDPNKDYLSELVGEGKKFADQQALARAKVESDAFVKRILDEKRQLEEDLKARVSMQDFLDQMKTQRPTTPQPDPVTNQVTAPASELTSEKIEELIQRQITNREAETARSRNLLTVQDKLTNALGSNYAEQVKQRAKDLGLDLQYFNDTAARSPQAFFELMGLNKPRPVDPSLPRGTSNPPVAADRNKNFAFFNKMRKENPVQYHSAVTQKEMFERAKDPSFFE